MSSPSSGLNKSGLNNIARSLIAAVNAEAVRAKFLAGLDLIIGRWAIWGAAAIIGGACAAAGYEAFRFTPASYPDFVVGYLTISSVGKAGDYAMLLAFIAGASLFFVGLAILFRRVFEAGGAAIVDDVYERFIIAVIPALAWTASFAFPYDVNIRLFWVSVLMTGAAAVGLWINLSRPAWFNGYHRALAPLDTMVLAPAAAVFAVFAMTMLRNRVGILLAPPWLPPSLYPYLGAAGAAAAAVVAAVTVFARDPWRATATLRNLLLAVQVFLPALFLVVLPAPIGPVNINHYIYPYAIPPQTWILLAAIVLAAWADLYRIWRRGRRDNDSPASAVSIFSLIAVIVYLRVFSVATLSVPSDDYHAGEDFIPWWAWIKHGMTPLWDFTPPRGLINYKEGLFAAIFTEPSAAGMLASLPYIYVALAFLVLPALALVIGKWRAFLVMCVATMDDRLGDIDALMTVCFCILIAAWKRLSHTGWLVAWVAVGTVAVLIAPGQGGLLVIATAPGGVWRAWCAWRGQRGSLLRAAAITAVVFAALALLTPLGLMIAGAIRYGVGQSAVNGIANGLPWSGSFGSVKILNPWLFELLRFSWIAVGVAAIVMTLWSWASPRRENRALTLFIGSTISLLCVLYIVRSAVRLDVGFVGRPGWTSIWALALLLPLLVSTLLRGSRRMSVMALLAAGAATLSGQFATMGVDWAFARPFIFLPLPQGPLVADGAALGLPNLGRVSLDKDRVDRLVTVKRHLDKMLSADETFIDMTNGGAQYFYFDRPPPSDLSAFYNMITADQQERAVKAIVAKNVPVAFIGPGTIIDGLTAGLRAPLVYRHLLLNFAPVALDGYDFMLRPERLTRLDMSAPDPTSDEAYEILDRNFVPATIDKLPITFGQAAGDLEHRMRTVAALDDQADAKLKNLERQGDGYLIKGDAPALTIDLTQKPLRGRDAGLLTFDFECLNARVKPTLTVAWAKRGVDPDARTTVKFAARNGTMIVPLDAFPRWLLSPALGTLSLGIEQTDGCTAVRFKNIVLAQRVEVDEMDAALNIKAKSEKSNP